MQQYHVLDRGGRLERIQQYFQYPILLFASGAWHLVQVYRPQNQQLYKQEYIGVYFEVGVHG